MHRVGDLLPRWHEDHAYCTSRKMTPKDQPASVPGAAGKKRPKPRPAPRCMTIARSSPGSQRNPLVTSKAVATSTVRDPAPSTEAAMPQVPAVPEVPGRISEAESC